MDNFSDSEIKQLIRQKYESILCRKADNSGIDHHFSHPLFPIPISCNRFDDLHRYFGRLLRWIYNDLAIWAKLVLRLQFLGIKFKGTLPDGYGKSQCSCMGGFHCIVWHCNR